jgi:hypothetical protein
MGSLLGGVWPREIGSPTLASSSARVELTMGVLAVHAAGRTPLAPGL